jgi:hypothetical protein
MIRLFLSESLISLHPDSVLNLPDTCQFFLSPTKYIPVRFSRVAICMQQSISPSPPSHSPTRRAIPDVHIYIYIYIYTYNKLKRNMKLESLPIKAELSHYKGQVDIDGARALLCVECRDIT